MSKDPKTVVKGAVELDPTSGKVGVSGELSGIPAIVNACRSPKAKLQHAIADRIARHATSGKPLDELTPFEQSLLVDANAESIKKAMNRARVLEKALKHDSGLAGLLAGPGSLEPENSPDAVEQQADERQRFWERFWADAECTSVEYVQEMYARILAGKARNPRSFSLATLDLMRCLDSETAKTFTRALRYAMGYGVIANVFKKADDLSLQDLLSLVDGRFISGTEMNVKSGCPYTYGPWFLRSSADLGRPTATLYVLTQAGREIASLIETEIEYSHVFVVCGALEAHYCKCDVADAANGPWLPWREYFKDELAKAESSASTAAPSDLSVITASK